MRINSEDIKVIRQSSTEIHDDVQAIRKELTQIREDGLVETRTMYPYFPATTNAQIYAFLDDSNDMFELKLKEFEKYLLQISNPSTSKKRQYSDTLFGILFHKDYQLTHRWPLLG